MYKIKEITINGFWYRFDAYCAFSDEVNIIIGRNGTGKTTFMNILHSVLSVDTDGLMENEFKNVEIILTDGRSKKTIKVYRQDNPDVPFCYFVYRVSRKKYVIRGFLPDERRIASHYRRRMAEESSELRDELAQLISLSSLSVYRLRSGDDFEIKDRSGKRVISPVDFRLSQLSSALTHYQLELSQKARVISGKLQKDVLASILYTGSSENDLMIPKKFDKVNEKKRLINAYARLGAADSEIRKKISYHISEIDEAFENFRSQTKGNEISDINFAAIDGYFRTQKIMSMSLDAEEKIKEVFSHINLFTDILKEFIPEKGFFLESGEMIIVGADGNKIEINRLSSGEKQLLILLIEALLQRQKPFVYLADEPELSLHIEWQRKILPAIRQLNPESQIIAATHSPEVASKYRSSLIDMKEVVSA